MVELHAPTMPQPWPSALTGRLTSPVTTKCPRRFCCQQASFSSLQNGCSLPLLTTVTRLGGHAEAHQVVLHRASRGGCRAPRLYLGAAARVAVAFERDLHAGPLLHPVRVLLQRRLRVVANRRLVEIEEHVVQRLLRVELIDRLAREDLLLAQRARRGRRWRRRRRRRRRRWRRAALPAVAAAAAAGAGGGNLLVAAGRPRRPGRHRVQLWIPVGETPIIVCSSSGGSLQSWITCCQT